MTAPPIARDDGQMQMEGSRTSIATVCQLAEATVDHGAKAATLGRLMQAGFTIPRGVVLSFAEGGAGTEGRAATATVDDAVRATEAMGDVSLAVRSSSSLEDGAHHAAAGQYCTVLNVRGADAVRSAVDQVLASAGGARMSVIVQQMVPAEASGVAFTVNPVTGSDEVVINAVRGLGDRLVSGVATPAEWAVNSTAALRSSGSVGGVLEPHQAIEIAACARKVADALGGPQDLEWAIAAGRLWLLQSRPITTLVEPVPIPIVVPPGFWEHDASHARTPRTPLTASVLDENAAVPAMFEQVGALADLVGANIGGWEYVGLQPVGAPPGAARVPPAWLLPILLTLSSAARRRMRNARRFQTRGLADEIVIRWRTEYEPSLRARIARLRDTDRGLLSDVEVGHHLLEAGKLAREGLRIHFQMAIPYLRVAELAFICRDLLGWDDEKALELVAGTSSVSSEPARELMALSALDRDDPAYDAKLADYQQTYGCRALDAELTEATFAESPGLVTSMLSSLRLRGFDGEAAAADLRHRREELAVQARKTLRGRDLRDFDLALARATEAYPLREANVFLTVDSPLALVRYAALEAGRRLVRRGQISSVDDVFYCDLDEIVGALVDDKTEPGADLASVTRRRRGERSWALAHPGPPAYGTRPTRAPSFKFLPRSVRRPTEAMMWIGQHIMPGSVTERGKPDLGEPLVGIAASAGAYTGPVRLIDSEADFFKIEPGDVLVCSSTRPSWSVIFPSLGAVVTDSGGSLSHPAIIAREHRLPAVVATGHATSLFTDGQIVTVDGSNGTVVPYRSP